MTDLIPRMPSAIVVHAELGEAARALAQHGKAENTKRAYRADWADFTAWCESHGRASLPAASATVGDYLADRMNDLTPATLDRRIAGVAYAHRLAGHPSPVDEQVRLVMSAIRRLKGSAQQQATAAQTDALRAMVRSTPATRAGARDRALLLVGFAAALRRSELVALDVADLAWADAGLVVTIRRSKTDQEGVGRQVAIPRGLWAETCPVRALRAWLDTAGITAGAVFRPVDRHGHVQAGRLSGNAVASVVKKCAAAAGLAGEWSGHSLRAGLATSAAAAGASDRQIARQTGHRSAKVLGRYIRAGELFRDNVAGQVGL